MNRFTEAEIAAIVDAAFGDDEGCLARLTETFGANKFRLAEAVSVADKLLAGEAVDMGDGQYLARDFGPGAGGSVIGRRS